MKRAAILGSPISHSLSPILHRRAYEILDIEAQYDAVEVPSGALSEFLKNVNQTNSTEWLGFSLTMPLKEEVLSLVDEIDVLAKRISSANTLIPFAPRKWRAYSTDVAGFIWALTANEVMNFKTVTIIGGGGTARAAAAAVDAPGRIIRVVNRSKHREAQMQGSINDSDLEFIQWGGAKLDSDLVINTTPKSVADNLPAGRGVLFEALYNPWPTELAKKWPGQVIDGLELLIHQAIDQIALMTGKSLNRTDFSKELRRVGLLKLEADR
mgnify:FL=1